MQTFLTQTALARRLNVCAATLTTRIRARSVLPDAVLVQGGRKPEAMLFDAERLPELRLALLNINPPLTS